MFVQLASPRGERATHLLHLRARTISITSCGSGPVPPVCVAGPLGSAHCGRLCSGTCPGLEAGVSRTEAYSIRFTPQKQNVIITALWSAKALSRSDAHLEK